MKKLALFILIIAAALPQASAQHYRGFVDVFGMYLTSLKPLSEDVEMPLGLGITTSHGAQFKNVFVGAGLGASVAYCGDTDPSGVFAFAHGRYDFFGSKKASFFIDLKLGYNFYKYDGGGGYNGGVDIDGVYYNGGVYYYYPSLYVQPAVGVRIRLKSHLGLNFMLGYQPLKFKREAYGSVRDEFGYEETISYSDHLSTPAINFSVGLDF